MTTEKPEKSVFILSDIELAAAEIGMPMPYTQIATLDADCETEYDVTFGLHIGAQCFYVFFRRKDGSEKTKVYSVKMEQIVNQIVNKLAEAR